MLIMWGVFAVHRCEGCKVSNFRHTMHSFHAWLETCCLSISIHETPWTGFFCSHRPRCAVDSAARSRRRAAALPQPTVEQRLADIEAYVNNTARATDGHAVSMIPGGGPGHNAWMMTSAALVLFMTLPGLALFYGGLVRRKNVLSILAQCLGLAAVVTILWWLCGYSLTYARGNAFIGGWAFPSCSTSVRRPMATTRSGFRTACSQSIS